MKHRHTRRDFLSALGLSAALGPFVPYLNRKAEAAGFPKRLVLTFAPNGTVESRFWPQGTEDNFDFTGQVTEPLKPYQKWLIFPRNLTRARARSNGGPHESALGCLWTGASLLPTPGRDQDAGYPVGPSIDQIIASKLPKGQTPFQSYALSVWHDELLGATTDPTTWYMTYSSANTPVIPDRDPYHAFSTLMLSGGGTGAVNADALAKVRFERTSVIDLVSDELRVLGTKVDVDDRRKIDNHVTSLREIEVRLQNLMPPMPPPGGTCVPVMLADGYQTKLHDNASFPALVQMQNDIAVAALACDRTRILSVQWSRTFSMLRHNWLYPKIAPHHTNSHAGVVGDTSAISVDALEKQFRISNWYCQQFAYLLGKMAQVSEGDGTLLDNTLAAWGYDVNDGAQHSVSPAIGVLAGGLGGKMNTGANGRLIDFAGKYDWTQLLVTMGHAMGVADLSKLGDLGVSGEIPGLLNP